MPGAGPDLRLALPVAVAWAATAVVIGFPDALQTAGVVAAVGAVLLLAVGIALRRHRRGRRTGVVITAGLVASACALLVSAAAGAAPTRSPPALVEAAASARQVVAEATVTESLSAGAESYSATLDVVTIGGRSFAVSVPVRVFAPAAEHALAIGSGVVVSGRVSLTEPGDATAFLFFSSTEPEEVTQPPGLLAGADLLRGGFRATASALPGEGGDLLPGLAIGDTGAVSEELDAAMKAASLSHLTAVSGANCAVVVGLVMLVGAAVGLGRTLRIVLSLITLAGFVVLVTPEPSVLRAAVMATIALAALAGGRPVRGVPMVALAVLVLLAIDPYLAREYGFVLSVLATVGLLVLAGPLTRVLARALPVPVAACLAIPLAAQLACQPVLILLAPAIPTYGVVANVLAGPAAPLATVLGLLACLTLPVLPGLGELLAATAWVPATWIAAVAQRFAALPGGSIPWPPGLVGVVLLVVLTASLLLAALARPGTLERTRRLALIVTAAGLVGYLGVAAGTALRSTLTRPHDWQYAACDVGQGDAVLVRSGADVALIDTGPDPEPLTGCLDQLGIGRLDLLVLTHFDLDHVGGASAVLGRADTVLVGPSDGVDADRLIAQLREGGARVQQVDRGTTGDLGDLRWTVLWPPEPLAGVEPGNEASVALHFAPSPRCGGGCLESVFLGDLGRESQMRLGAAAGLAAGRARVDVVKVAHHGSADQDPALYAALDARVALIGVGADNDYGHPTSQLLELLSASGTAVGRTDVNGLVLVAAGAGGTIELWSERDDG